MLSEKINQVVSDVVVRLEEIRRAGGDPEKIWARRISTQLEVEPGVDYELDITVRLKK